MVINASIADLDELILLCRDDRARSYIAEAVSCYRGGAYRAAIVATWIAVCFDIIDKLRELNLTGDKAAEKVVKDLDKARESNDILSSLRFERELLDIARDKFELLSHLEHIDLNRLQEDRNRCAHPSMLTDNQVFQPSAELARLHIRSAVTHLLQHPPVQGKSALERLVREVGSEYFPNDVNKATASLSSGPLKKPRESLVRNFNLVLIKAVLSKDTEWKQRNRSHAALGAVRRMHPAMFESVVNEKLTTLFRGVEDGQLYLVVDFLNRVQDCWQHLETDVCHRLEHYVLDMPTEHLDELVFLLSFKPLRDQALRRLAKATMREFESTSFWGLPVEIANKYVEIYLASKNYAEANSWAKEMSLYASDFSEDQQRRIIEGIGKNSQIAYSLEVSNFLRKLRQTQKIVPSEFEKLLVQNELERYTSIEVEQD